VLLVALAAAAAVHLAVALLDFGTLARNGFLYDDSFYAFQIARNIAHGLGPTFDGVHLTNGFQPLYVMLLVPVFALAGDSPSLPVHIALIMSAFLTLATALMLYRLIVRHASPLAAGVATVAWAISPVVTRQSANGLETALAVFMLAASVTWYLEKVRGCERPSRRRFAVMGALLGGAFLARADLGFLALAMTLDYLLVARARRVPHWGARLAVAAGVGVLVCAPWMLYGTLAVGIPIPESGRATRYLSLAYAPFFDLGGESLVREGPSWDFIAAHATRSVETLKVIPAFHPLFRGLQKLGDRFGAPGLFGMVANIFEALALAGFAAWWFWRRRLPRGRPAREFDFLLLVAVMFIAAYSTVVFGVFFFLRYYYPIYFIGALFTGLMLDDVIAWVRGRSVAVRRGALLAGAAYAAALLFMGYTSAFRTTPVYGFYDAARWVNHNTDASDTIGVFQGGAIGYLSERRVVNLDGKVNREAFRALRERRLDAYVLSSGIDVVMDSERVLNLFLGPWSDAERTRIESQSIFSGSEYGVPGWIGYRVSVAHGMNASVPGGPTDRSAPSRQP
jgi:4-amino-4-deoxy-L-arabinose transferase-like glycosyltransferase